MQTIRTKVLFISLLFSAVMLPTMMQASEKISFDERREPCWEEIAKMMQANEKISLDEKKAPCWEEVTKRMQAVSLNEKKVQYWEEIVDYYTLEEVLYGKEGSRDHVVDEDDFERILKERIAGERKAVNINARSERRHFCRTHLIGCAIFIDKARALLFLNRNAEVINMLDSTKTSPLMYAIDSEYGTEKERLEFIELLLEKGAKDTGKNYDDESIWTCAEGKSAVTDLLKEYLDE